MSKDDLMGHEKPELDLSLLISDYLKENLTVHVNLSHGSQSSGYDESDVRVDVTIKLEGIPISEDWDTITVKTD